MIMAGFNLFNGLRLAQPAGALKLVVFSPDENKILYSSHSFEVPGQDLSGASTTYRFKRPFTR